MNLFLPADVHKRDLHQTPFAGLGKGLKSLYYLRSKSLQRADVVSIGSRRLRELAACRDDDDRHGVPG